jgi:hypothetical protein
VPAGGREHPAGGRAGRGPGGVVWTVMAAVIEHGAPLVDDPGRVGPVQKLGVDETACLKAN